MLEKLISWIQKKEREGVSKDQVEAAADLLVWVMYADGHIASAETETIDAELRRLGWTSPFAMDLYLQGATARARRALEDPSFAETYLSRASERLGTNEMRQRVLDACADLAAADGDSSAAESRLLDKLQEAFKL
ncbi:MAG: hypothetical protein GX614_00270 [Sandaracinaceae bacterium]|nr:hypothetical protein [Sandaracinaceae bacterium]